MSDAERATEATLGDHEVSSSKRKRAREARKLAARVKAALDEGRIEEDIKGVKMEKVFSRCSTKQAMIARVRFYVFLRTSLTPYFSHLSSLPYTLIVLSTMVLPGSRTVAE